MVEDRKVACTPSPTIAPTGCYPQDEYTWSEERSAEVCEGKDQGVTDKTWGAPLCSNSLGTEADFHQALAWEMFSKCNSLCIYDHERMWAGMTAEVYHAKNGQWRWDNTEKCWEYGNDGYATCIRSGIDPVEDWIITSQHLAGMCM